MPKARDWHSANTGREMEVTESGYTVIAKNGVRWGANVNDVVTRLLGTPRGTQAVRSERFRKGRTPSPEEAIQMMNQSSSSPGDSPASLSPVRDEDEERMMTVTSGLRCLESYPRSGPLGSLARMLVASSAWHNRAVSLTWKVKPILMHKRSRTYEQTGLFGELSKTLKESATHANRLLFRLAPSARRTAGIAFSLLPTPDTQANRDGTCLRKDNNLDQGGSHGVSLHHRIAMLPTPTGRDHKDGTNTENVPENALLGGVIPNTGQNTGTPLRLEPALVIWMMGYPPDWLDIE